LHQVCSSVFANQSWIDYLATPIQASFFSNDFRATSPSAFQALRTFCELIDSTIADSLSQFYSHKYISAFVIPEKLFVSETESLNEQFKWSMINDFLLALSMIRDTTQANALFSGLRTNYGLIVAPDNHGVLTGAKAYGDCRCSFSSSCIDQSSIYKYPSTTRLFNISGFYTGCYVIESLLQSTLQCFYDQQCIDRLQVHLPPSSSMNVTALDSSFPSNYSVNSTIKHLVNNMMIELWNTSPIYENYYNACQPTHCIYTVETRNDVIYIVNTLFGIVGGVITVLKFILPRLVKIVRKKKREQPQPSTGKTSLRMVKCMKLNFNV
jgi:hypothetical protein